MLLDNIKELRKIENLLALVGDGTYEIAIDDDDDGVYYINSATFRTGYQVSCFNDFNTRLFPEDLEKDVESFKHIARLFGLGKRIYVGVYEGKAEFSIRVMELEVAKWIGRACIQKSIWDWENMEKILLD